MNNARVTVPSPRNEPVLNYAPGSPEKAALRAQLDTFTAGSIEIPLIIGGRNVTTGDLGTCVLPHDHGRSLATYHKGNVETVNQAIAAAADARPEWSAMPWESRAAIFLKAAELLAGKYRQVLNAATMLNQSKTAFQAEIDAACELIDFWRFNAHFMEQIYRQQPLSASGDLGQGRIPGVGGFCLRRDTVQLHFDRGQPPRRPSDHGQRLDMEASVDSDSVRLLPDEDFRRGRTSARSDQLPSWAGRRSRRSRAFQSASSRHPFHRLDSGLPGNVADRWKQHRPLPLISSHRR